MQPHSINEIRRRAEVHRAVPDVSVDIHQITAQARVERNLFIGKLIAGAVRSVVSSFKAAQARRHAFAQLSSMSNRELADIGLTRGDITAAVYADSSDAHKRPRGAFAALRRYLAKLGEKRAAYMELMSLDDHMLQDIGIARSEIGGFLRGEDLRRRSAANVNEPRSVA